MSGDPDSGPWTLADYAALAAPLIRRRYPQDFAVDDVKLAGYLEKNSLGLLRAYVEAERDLERLDRKVIHGCAGGNCEICDRE
jgi:hypothetical protein